MYIDIKQMQSPLTYWHPAFLIAFANNLQILLVGIDVRESEIDKLGNSQAAVVKQFHNDIVASAFWCTLVEGGLYGRNLFIGKHIWQMFWPDGKVKHIGRAVGYGVFDDEHFVEHAPTGNHATLAV